MLKQEKVLTELSKIVDGLKYELDLMHKEVNNVLNQRELLEKQLNIALNAFDEILAQEWLSTINNNPVKIVDKAIEKMNRLAKEHRNATNGNA